MALTEAERKQQEIVVSPMSPKLYLVNIFGNKFTLNQEEVSKLSTECQRAVFRATLIRPIDRARR